MNCQCGCGQDAGLWPKTYRRLGVRKGDPKRYILGHRCKKDMDSLYVVDETTGCWDWVGNLENGYARLGQKLAYVLFYVRAKGPKPVGTDLDHVCRNRSCVNPDHLEAVSRAVNARRGARSILTMAQADSIRAQVAASPQRGLKTEIARKYGVSRTTISNLVHRKTWIAT